VLLGPGATVAAPGLALLLRGQPRSKALRLIVWAIARRARELERLGSRDHAFPVTRHDRSPLWHLTHAPHAFHATVATITIEWQVPHDRAGG